jgi:hypothetical protein
MTRKSLLGTALVLFVCMLLITSMVYTTVNPRPIEYNAVVTLYDDGSVRVVEHAGQVQCYQDGHAIDCISRGLKRR